MPCLLCYEMSSTLLRLRRYGFHYRDMGRTFHEYILHIFRNGWMDYRNAFHAVLCFILLCNRQNIAEYKVYWPMGVRIVNP